MSDQDRSHPSFATLKVSDSIWQFDENSRTYVTGPNGHQIGAPIYGKHFRQHIIVGETKQSWLVLPDANWAHDRATKVNKKNLTSAGKGYSTGTNWHTDASMEDAVWSHDHYQAILRKLETHRGNPAILKQVAALIDYTE